MSTKIGNLQFICNLFLQFQVILNFIARLWHQIEGQDNPIMKHMRKRQWQAFWHFLFCAGRIFTGKVACSYVSTYHNNKKLKG